MNNQSHIDSLTDDCLDEVAGGMKCSAAKALAAVYESCAKIYAAMGDHYMSNLVGGRGIGVREGACT